MLDNDIPVCLSIGSNEPGVKFYNLDRSDITDPYKFVIAEYLSKDGKLTKRIVNDHYITVTGMLEDQIKKKTYLEISSWGEKFYIDFEEYIDYINKTNDVFSNILYLQKT